MQNDISAKSRDLAQPHASKQSQEIIRKQKSDSEGHESNFDNADSSSSETRLTSSSDYSGSVADNKADKRSDLTDADKPKNDEVSTQKSVKATKDDRAAADSANNGEKQSEVKKDEDGRYDFSDDTNITNPFPNVITPAEVKELQDKKPTARYDMPGIFKTFYTPAGKDFSVENAKTKNFTIQIKATDFPHAYDKDFVGRIDSFIFIPQVENDEIYTGEAEIYPLWSSREFKYEDGSVGLDDKNTTKRYIPFTLEVNGRIIGKNFKSEVKIKYLARKKQTFVHIISYTDKNDEAIYGNSSFNIDNANITYPWIGVLPECGAQFHFVDDLKYRKTMNLSASDNIPQRSASETDKFSTKPFTKLDLSDLKKSIIVEKLLVGNNQVISRYIPLLNFADKPDDSIKRPTMDELKNTNITGYLYYSNDIDTPKDGTFTTKNADKKPGNFNYGIVRDKDDNQLNTKHYYVTFRPIPTQLVVRYKNLQNKIESGEQFALYVGDKQIAGDFKSSESSAAPELKALQSMITNKNTALLSEAAGYLSNGFAYLSPGNYIVKSAAEAPTNYEWVVEPENSADINSAPIDAKFNIAVHKDNSISTQKVVTFVLRRKIATVKFINDDDKKPYATVKVQQGLSISGDGLTDQSMPKNPSKKGYTFREWNADSTGKDRSGIFTEKTTIKSDITVYAIYDLNATVMNVAPTLTLQDKTITVGDSLNLNSLVVSAKDPEDGDLKNEVKITNNGGFDNTKPGVYKVTFTLSDKGKASVTKTATVTVVKKPTPTPTPTPTPDPEPTPVPEPESKPTPEKTPEPDVMPEPEPIPVPDVPDVPYVPDDSWIPLPEIVPENPEYSVVEQPVLNPVHSSDKPVEYSVEQRFKAVDAGEAYSAKAPAKHLPDTGVSLVMSISALFVSLFAGFGLSMFKSRRKN